MKRWLWSWRARESDRGAGRRAFLRHVGGATAAVVGAQAVDVRTLLFGPGGPAAVTSAAASATASAPAPEAGAGLGVAGSAPSRVAPAYPLPWAEQMALEELTLDDFVAHVNTSFRVHGAAGPVDVLLARATPLGAAGTAGRHAFALLFQGPAASRLEQGTYKLQHGTLGVFDLFVVPMESSGEAPRYEAVFNRASA